MLRNRVITALILAPIAISAVFLLSAFWFGILFWGVAALALYEWAGLAGLRAVAARVCYVAVFAGCAALIHTQPQIHAGLVYAGCLVWAGAALAVLVFPRGAGVYAHPVVLAPLGLFIGCVAWLAITRIHGLEQGSYWVVWMFGVVWGADVGAYFAGRAFGRHKLAPAVSPSKTWEGVAGGALLAVGVCGSIIVWWQPRGLLWLALTLGLVMVSVFGDLFESALKRATGVKDSGNLLPGHGGMLDRIDSILAVLPVLAVLLA